MGLSPERAGDMISARAWFFRALAALLVLVAGPGWPPTGAGAQTAPAQHRGAAARAGEPAARIGLCQCIADRASLHMLCLPSAPQCEAACASTHYSFVPVIRNVLALCPPKELYLVLPNADGRPGAGAINVERGGANTLLDRSYAAAELREENPAQVPVETGEVQAVFGPALAAMPMLPSRFRLVFRPESDELSAESGPEYRKLLADIKRRSIYQVEVASYADGARRGRNPQAQAEALRAALIRDGVDERTISLVTRTRPVEPAAPGKRVAELRTDQVEVTVR